MGCISPALPGADSPARSTGHQQSHAARGIAGRQCPRPRPNGGSTVFRCPTDTTPGLLPKAVRDFGDTAGPTFEPATSNYVGSCGLFDRDYPTANDGVLYGNRAIRFADVTDGTSNTFAVGERDGRCGASAWCGVRTAAEDAWVGPYFVYGNVELKLNFPIAGEEDDCTEGFSSAHAGGGYFLFCDGSVHFISDTIDSRCARFRFF